MKRGENRPPGRKALPTWLELPNSGEPHPTPRFCGVRKAKCRSASPDVFGADISGGLMEGISNPTTRLELAASAGRLSDG